MPLVRVSYGSPKTPTQIAAIGEGIYQAMIETIKVPKDDRFQIFTPHPAENLIYSRDYLGIERSDDFVLIQVFLNGGRTLEMKKAFYAAIAKNLHANPGVRKEDIFINLVEVAKENWSFGNGIAQYAD